MPKKILGLFILVLLGVLVACTKPDVTVTFDSQGGSAVAAITVKEGSLVEEPEDPTRAPANEESAWTFTGWFTTAAATGEPFDFSKPVNESITLYAGWTQNIVVRFNTKTTATVPSQILPAGGGVVQAPTAPTRDGYRFGGWFRGRPGLTWLEPQAVSFPLTVTGAVQLFAYWEPLNSKTVNYSAGETYVTTFITSQTNVLNPLTYQWSHENAYIAMLATDLYSTEVDWAKAITQGVAAYPGDFSKIEAREFSIEALDYVNIKVGAARFPVDSTGDEHLTPDGKYDREGSTTFTDTKWTIHLRQDLKFEDGTPITAHTYEYTLKQYLDQKQNNYRANLYYRDDVSRNGYPIKNASEYFKQTTAAPVAWSEVGFKVISDYVFEVEFYMPQSQSAVTGFANMRLVHPTAYAASLNAEGVNSTYGTATNPYISYGPYIIKSWDANQKIVFNKNYEYVAKETVTYKSQVVEMVPDIQSGYNLFKNGTTSVLGLNNDYYAEFAESDNLYKSWDGYPQYLIINTAGSRITGASAHVQPSIVHDARFRQALLYGFDRNYFATSVYAPNTASVLPVPLDTKAYVQDALYYSESPNHLAVLQKYNIDPDGNAFIPDRAVQLFNQAYDAWVAEGNTGPVTLRYVASNSTTLAESLALYVKQSLEARFTTNKLIINIVWGDSTATSAQQRDWNFDIALSAIGFGVSYGIQWQYGSIAFLGAIIGAANLGLSQPYSTKNFDPNLATRIHPTLDVGYADYYNEIIEIDLTATYNYLLSIEDDETTPADYLKMLSWLEATDTKPAGIYKDTVAKLGGFLYSDSTPYDATAAAPFTGATQDVWKIIAAFEDVFFKYVPLIPTVTRSSATVYAPNVVITWPAYSSAFAWGANRYRYLNTDPDFANGFFNSFA